MKISSVIVKQTAIAFPQRLGGSMHVRQELQDIDMEKSIRLRGIMKIQEVKPMKLEKRKLMHGACRI
jgi:hypothetical protein